MQLKMENILNKEYEMYNRYGIKSVTMDDFASMWGNCLAGRCRS